MNTATQTERLSKLARKVSCSAKYGDISTPWDKLDDWQRQAHPYRVRLRYQGRQMSLDFFMGQAHTDEPDAAEVLSCLLSDASACDQSFEEWASELGYETDSRKAERVYNMCVKQGEKLKLLLGDDFERFLYAENDV